VAAAAADRHAGVSPPARRRIRAGDDAGGGTHARLLAAADANGEPLDVFAEMMRVTLQIALETLMGVAGERETDELSRAVTEVLERTNDIITNPFSLPPGVPTPKARRFRAAIATLDRFVYDTIARRRSEGAAPPSSRPDDLLSMLMAARDEETGEAMSTGSSATRPSRS
jgi:cytochrome P450